MTGAVTAERPGGRRALGGGGSAPGQTAQEKVEQAPGQILSPWLAVEDEREPAEREQDVARVEVVA
ncbi:hypothetical protein QOZ89_42145 [Pseudofrankia sp. BMG5.37]|uniref:hypothetical protein n=1 Tax=Pseudofrankia sp. BMG5.36 TaxID=1834512 RepID=UPI0008D9795C|nr:MULTISPECIES: hypothetical protein [unclassified Pseudofrankia]MDT3446133.1 hypothetical protein [Pseudofrankia sp. BMG5.37]OHV62263.1 hypothetical protein BCD48_39345 [Pseudofrankia sp. BMG5.36]